MSQPTPSVAPALPNRPAVEFTRAGKGVHGLSAQAFVPLPVEEVFSFFSRAENLNRITPPELRFRILTPTPIEMAQGTRILYKLRLGRIPLTWVSEITEWAPPHGFTDTQVAGPYRTWVHRHSFEPRDGGTVMGDDVRFQLPYAPLSGPALPLVRRQLRRIFQYRQESISRLLLAGH